LTFTLTACSFTGCADLKDQLAGAKKIRLKRENPVRNEFGWVFCFLKNKLMGLL
jgi:hypothetical protein